MLETRSGDGVGFLLLPPWVRFRPLSWCPWQEEPASPSSTVSPGRWLNINTPSATELGSLAVHASRRAGLWGRLGFRRGEVCLLGLLLFLSSEAA